VKHFHGWYQREHGGQRSYTWVKQALQTHGAVVRAKARGKHRKVSETIARHGLFCSLYTDRGRHYFHTPEAGGKVDRGNPTQFGRGLSQLGIEHIAAYSPEARGRSERAFGTHQQRLPQELSKAGITDMSAANAYLQAHDLPRHNTEFTVPAAQGQRVCGACRRRSVGHFVRAVRARGGPGQLRAL